MSDAEAVGSVGEEAWKLLRALSGPAATEADAGATPPEATLDPRDTDEQHSCPTGWCPICQVVGYVRDHPEAVARVSASAASLLHSIRDLLATSENPR